MSLGGAMMAGAIVGGITGMSVGVGVSIINNNPLWSWQTVKNASVGLVLGASLGAVTGGGIWLYGNGLLGMVVNRGFSGLWTKIINRGGHSTTAKWMTFGACVGFLTGFYEPNVMEGVSIFSMEVTTTLSTFMALNASNLFSYNSRNVTLRNLMTIAQRQFLNRNIQSISFVTAGFTTGLVVGYILGVVANNTYTYVGGDPEGSIDEIYDYSINKIAEWSLLVY
ncbi:MAG: hypothetical protein LBJ00_10250 [Planctomycetaceae bacterium]|jgi:hypothetical protein|nr:hypothetical protein [Planctomycetaceae bacterium]